MKVIREPAEPAEGAENVSLGASDFFVATKAIENLARRAFSYLDAGYSIHLSGPAGSGKTTLAFHIAAQLNRPVTLIAGDHQMTSADLVGSANGVRKTRLVDNYVRSVVRTEEHQTTLWSDNRLTSACRYGHTLIYDEFNRTPPEANNPLLGVLSEGVLTLPKAHEGAQNYVDVHPDFRAIFTSNPQEYVAVFKTGDALLDRVINLRVELFDAHTECEIIAARSGVSKKDAEVILGLVAAARKAPDGGHLSIRSGIAIGRVIMAADASTRPDNEVFRWAVEDILGLPLERILALS